MTAHPYTGDPNLKTRTRRTLRAQVATQLLPCQAPNCKHPDEPIDYRPQRRGEPWNPLAYELGEIIPRALGGRADDPNNVRPEHADCNRAGGGPIARGQVTVDVNMINSELRTKINNGPVRLIADSW